MRKLIGLVIVLVLILALFSSLAVIASTVEEELFAIGIKFEQAFENGDLKTFEELFWHDERLTVFWPDPNTAFRIDGWSQFLQGYLKGMTYYLSQLPPGTVNFEIRQPSINVMEDVAILTSYWILTMPTPEGGMAVSQGRATFVCKKIEGKWVIIHAHASTFPTP